MNGKLKNKLLPVDTIGRQYIYIYIYLKRGGADLLVKRYSSRSASHSRKILIFRVRVAAALHNFVMHPVNAKR